MLRITCIHLHTRMALFSRKTSLLTVVCDSIELIGKFHLDSQAVEGCMKDPSTMYLHNLRQSGLIKRK